MRRLVLTLAAVAACGGGQKELAKAPAEPDAAVGEKPLSSEEEQLAAIEKAIGERGPGVYQCRSLAAADDLRVDGEIELSLTLGEDSRVSAVAVVKDSVGDAILSECLQKLWTNYMFDGTFAVGDTIALPPFRFVAEGAQYLVSAAHARMVRQGGLTTASVLSEKNTGNPAAAVDLLQLDDDSGIGRFAPTKSGSDSERFAEVLFVFAGAGTVSGPGVKRSYEGASAFYAPAGVPYVLRDAEDGQHTRLMRFRVRSKIVGKAAFFRSAKEAEELGIAGGKATIRLYFDKGVVAENSAYLGHFEAKPGLSIPEHVHVGASEYLFIMKGEGRMTVEGKEFPVSSGDAIQVPPDTKHSFVSTGSVPLEALQLYTPSGPEQRFRK